MCFWKNVAKEKKTSKYIMDNIELFSDCDRRNPYEEYSDEENCHEKCSDEESSEEKNFGGNEKKINVQSI